MTLPDDLTTCVITGTFLDCAGHPLDGSLTIAPSTDVTDATGAVVIPMAERVYTFSGQGTITTDALVSTDNETVSPSGWTYGLTLQVAGLAPKSWSILLPHSGTPVDISGITPVTSQPGLTSYVPQSGGSMGGTLTLNGDPHPLKIPAGAQDDYVLTSDADGNASWEAPAGGGSGLPLTGGTLTGPLTLDELDLEDASTARGSLQSIAGDLWILANATWDGTNFHRIDITKAAFGFQIQGQNNIPGEPVPGATMWVAQPESYTLIRGGGLSGGDVYTAVGGWELGYTLTSQRQLTVGGAGIEIDGYGTTPYGRVVSSQTGSVLSRHLAGMVRNAFPQMDGADDTTQESWFWGYVDQFTGGGVTSGSNHWAVAYLPADTLPFGGVFDEYLTVSADGTVEVSADPTTDLGVATKHYVDTAGGGGGAVSSVFTRTGAVTANSGDYTVSQVTGAAPLASPALTGSPTAPTQTTGDSSTKIATDAFVSTAVAAALPLAGGTMSGAIAMGSHKVTGLTNGSSAQDAAAYGQTPAGGTTVTVGQGGTGDTSLTAYAPLAGGTTSTGALQQCTTGLSTSGNVLTSNGSSALPSFQAPASGGGAAVSTATYGTASETLNAASFGAFLITLSGTPTFTFSGASGGTECSFTLYLIQPASGSTFYTPVWPGSVKWQDAVPPSLSAVNSATDILVFASPDGGTNWYGSLAGANY